MGEGRLPSAFSMPKSCDPSKVSSVFPVEQRTPACQAPQQPATTKASDLHGGDIARPLHRDSPKVRNRQGQVFSPHFIQGNREGEKYNKNLKPVCNIDNCLCTYYTCKYMYTYTIAYAHIIHASTCTPIQLPMHILYMNVHVHVSRAHTTFCTDLQTD